MSSEQNRYWMHHLTARTSGPPDAGHQLQLAAQSPTRAERLDQQCVPPVDGERRQGQRNKPLLRG